MWESSASNINLGNKCIIKKDWKTSAKELWDISASVFLVRVRGK